VAGADCLDSADTGGLPADELRGGAYYPDAACHSDRNEHKGHADPCAHFADGDGIPDGLPLPVSAVAVCNLDTYPDGDAYRCANEHQYCNEYQYQYRNTGAACYIS